MALSTATCAFARRHARACIAGAAWAFLVIGAALTSSLRAQGFAPPAALERMTLASGFKASLVAHEPMMAQPVCIEFDFRGRLWVVQYLQYPNPAGLKRVKVDRYSRTVYDRVPEPPPHGPRGADRITILEDTDGDGVADRARDFVAGLNLATSVAFGHGGVFVLQPPYLLFYPDRDEDDVPDSDPEVLLSGFGIEDAQAFANSLLWGPDGWLYGCQGSTVTAHVRGHEFQQAIWRYHPVSRRFELFSEGGGNMWGLDYDRDGNLLASTNGGGGGQSWSIDVPLPVAGRLVSGRMIHIVPGAYYAKNFGKHGELHNAHAYGYFARVPARSYKGFHVTPGGTLYYGDTFPEEFRGRFLANDLLGHAVQWCTLEPWGTTFTTNYGGDLLVANDTWFAPSDMTTGPDGAVYVADWSDQRMSHPDPDADWDRSNGRVYRIQWHGAAATSATQSMKALLNGVSSLTKLPTARLVEFLAHRNDWIVRKARRVLADRRDASAYSRLRELVSASDGSQLSLEALWALQGSGGCDEPYLRELLDHPSPRIRRWAVRFLGDKETTNPTTSERLIQLAAAEPDAAVRSQLASTAARLAPEAGLQISQQLARRDRDAADAFIPMLLWWAVERHSVVAIDRTVALFNAPATWNSTLARRSLLPRLVRRYAAEGTSAALQACATLLAGIPIDGDRGPFVAALEQGLRHKSPANRAPKIDDLPAALVKQILALWDARTQDETLIRLLAWLDFVPARERAATLAADTSNPPSFRAAMVGALANPVRTQDTGRLLHWFSGTEPEEVKAAALGGLQQIDSSAVTTALLREYSKLGGASIRAKVRAGLLSRPQSALALLEHIEAGAMPASEVAQAELRPLAQFGDPRIDALVRKHWGKIHSTPGEQLAVVRRFGNDLSTNRDKPPGDPLRGRALFQQFCGACHRLHDEGGTLGPDLTAANRGDTEFLLVSLVDPSAVIRKEYLNYVVKTTDGRTLYGQVAGESAGGITLVGANNEQTELARDRIASMEDTGVSLMPPGLLDAFTPQQRRDLFSYLQSEKPPPSRSQP